MSGVAGDPARILFLFASLEDDGDTTFLLAQALGRTRHLVEIVVCHEVDNASMESGVQPEALAVTVDRAPCHLSFDATVTYLATKMSAYDIVISCQDVADIYPALERLHLPPPLIEVGVIESEAVSGPKHLTTRFVGESSSIREAAAQRMPGREHHAVEIAPMNGLSDSDAVSRWTTLLDDVLAERPAGATPTGLFKGFLQGGFECSTHRRGHDRVRLDVIAASHHDVHADYDYRLLKAHGLVTIRDGLRWHLIEQQPGRYDWSSLNGQLSAATATGVEVIWDLLHYGWPDDIDIWTPAFVTRFATFAAAAARHIGPAPLGGTRFYAPVNEISFLSWGGGDVGYLNPFGHGRGRELKVQLARAAIAAMEAILAVDPAARFVHADPLINIVADPTRPDDIAAAEGHRLAQFEAWDMIAGRTWPQIGGRPELLDIVGINFYQNNQWVHDGHPLAYDDALARPFHELLAEVYARYGRPLFVAETGCEGDARAPWLEMILAEVDRAIARGVPVEGVCLYPVLDHPGWDDDRYCPNGLIACASDEAGRVAHPALARVIADYTRGASAVPNSASIRAHALSA